MTTKSTHRRLLFFAAMAALLLAACHKVDTGAATGSTDASGGVICFEPAFATWDGAVRQGPQSRVATNTTFTSAWEEGDEIGIFAVEHGETLAASGNYIHNAKLTYSGGTWKAENIYWPQNGTKLDFYAYYPYNAAATNPLAIAFTLPEDQSATVGNTPAFNRANIMTAKGNNKDKYDGTVPLVFNQAMAMVEVKVSDMADQSYPADALDVYLNGCTTATQLNLSTLSAVATSPTATKIKMYACPNDGSTPGIYAYRAFVPVQTIAAGTALFRFVLDGGTTLLGSEPLTQQLTLSRKQVEMFDMTFPFESVTLSPGKRLTDLFTPAELKTMTHLKLMGEMTAEDFETISKMYDLTRLDLGGATVADNTIPNRAFSDIDLQEFIFPQGITTIGEYAFSTCKNLSGSLTIPSTVKEIGKGAFGECDGFTGTLTIPEGVTTIGQSAFGGCENLSGTLTIPSTVTTIGYLAFESCSGFTGSLTIPEGVTTIGSSAFMGCSGFTGSLTISEGVTTIGASAFMGCSGFTGSLTISEGVTTIGNSAFKGCSGFTGTLTIPKSITKIDHSAFARCSSLSSITCHIPDPNQVSYGIMVFDDVPTTIPVRVPADAVEAYKAHAVWQQFSNIQPIP